MTAMLLSPREAKRRAFILNGNLWSVVVAISAPLAIYSVFNYLYTFFDMILAARIDATGGVASLLIFDDIKAAVSAVGIGIAAAGTVFVARHYGAGEFEEARRNAAGVLSLAVGASIVFAALTMLFWRPLLTLLNTPDEVVANGLGYFLVQIASTVLLAFNSVYMGIERAKGNTKTILALNIVAMAFKMILSAFFVLGMGKGMTHVALATLLAQGMLAILAALALFRKSNSIAIRVRDLRFSKAYTLPILQIALPVIAGKFLFSIGRVFVNSIGTVFGTKAIAAFGIAMRISSAAGTVASVFEDPTTSIASQNLGARRLRRAFQTYGIANLLAALLGFAGVLLLSVFLQGIIPWFTRGDADLVPLVTAIYNWERWSVVSSATIVIVSGFFLGFKITKVTFVLNVIRLFFLRIPALLIFAALGTGPIAFGYAMFISNVGTALIALVMIFLFHRRVASYGYLDMTLAPVA